MSPFGRSDALCAVVNVTFRMSGAISIRPGMVKGQNPSGYVESLHASYMFSTCGWVTLALSKLKNLLHVSHDHRTLINAFDHTRRICNGQYRKRSSNEAFRSECSDELFPCAQEPRGEVLSFENYILE